eukprot:5327545-Lingulodinium_polyedra.AAC.1
MTSARDALPHGAPQTRAARKQTIARRAPATITPKRPATNHAAGARGRPRAWPAVKQNRLQTTGRQPRLRR